MKRLLSALTFSAICILTFTTHASEIFCNPFNKEQRVIFETVADDNVNIFKSSLAEVKKIFDKYSIPVSSTSSRLYIQKDDPEIQIIKMEQSGLTGLESLGIYVGNMYLTNKDTKYFIFYSNTDRMVLVRNNCF